MYWDTGTKGLGLAVGMSVKTHAFQLLKNKVKHQLL